MKFTWDDNKEKANITKHGIDFLLAARVFADENRLELYDIDHSIQEDRYVTIGAVGSVLCVIFVVYNVRGDAIRIISARKATERERRLYYECIQGY